MRNKSRKPGLNILRLSEVYNKHTFMDENAKQRIFSIHREVFWNEPLPEL